MLVHFPLLVRFSIIILSLITIIGVVSCFILCNEERELMQEMTLDTPLREAYQNVFISAEEAQVREAAAAAAANGDGGGNRKSGKYGKNESHQPYFFALSFLFLLLTFYFLRCQILN